MLCPCSSGEIYDKCCGPYHQGALPPTALALMRSRYSAYALKISDYIIETTHPTSPYYEKDRKLWKRAIDKFSQETTFINLKIIEFGEDWVFFIASLEQGSKPFRLEEKSHFLKEKGKWLYHFGEFSRSSS